MEYLVGDSIGFLHLVTSCLALIFGTAVLILKKGTRIHKILGYFYVLNMSLLILTAFMIYRLFDGFGIFHYTTILSLITLLLGMVPIWLKKPVRSWKYLHFSFMYWSVIGLYAAFVAEILTRIPDQPFYDMLGISIGVVMLVGGFIFGIKSKHWKKILSI